LGGRKGKGWKIQPSLDIGGLYLPLGGLSYWITERGGESVIERFNPF